MHTACILYLHVLYLCVYIPYIPKLTESILNNYKQMLGWKGSLKDNLSMAFRKEPCELLSYTQICLNKFDPVFEPS